MKTETTCTFKETAWHFAQCKHCSLFNVTPTVQTHLCKSCCAARVYSNTHVTSDSEFSFWSRPPHASIKMMSRRKSLPAHLKNCSSRPTINPHNRAPLIFHGLSCHGNIGPRVSQTRSFNPFRFFFFFLLHWKPEWAYLSSNYITLTKTNRLPINLV